jgi:hypothetical protein
MTTSRELSQALTDAINEDQVAVPIRALIASVLMSARGGAPTRLGMSKVGGYSYGSSQTHYGDLLDALCERVPHLVADMATDIVDPAGAAKLRNDLQQRDASLAALRAENAALTERHEHLRRYALAVHERLRSIEGDGSLSEARVLPFQPLG